MAILSDMLNMGMMGEPARLDHVIREHERLEAKFNRLAELLTSKGLITKEERLALESQETSDTGRESDAAV